MLHASVGPDSGQTLLSGMGELHLEIARDRLVHDLKSRYGENQHWVSRNPQAQRLENCTREQLWGRDLLLQYLLQLGRWGISTWVITLRRAHTTMCAWERRPSSCSTSPILRHHPQPKHRYIFGIRVHPISNYPCDTTHYHGCAQHCVRRHQQH